MRKLLAALLLLISLPALAQFTPGQILTAAQLNNQFALYVPLAGATLTGPLMVPAVTVTGTTTLNSIATSNATITGGTISGLSPPIGFASGGTNATTQAAALTSILGSSTVPIANGGTNAATATAATGNLQYLFSATGSGARALTSKFGDTVSVLDFSGVDATGSTDSTTGIQNAINYAATVSTVIQNGVKVNFPRGTYKISSSLNLTGKSGVVLAGESRQSTVIQQTANAPAIVDNGTLSAVDNNTGVQSMWIQCPGLSNTSAHGVSFTYVNSGTIRDLFLTGCYHALDMQDQWQTVIDNVRVYGAGGQQNYDGLYAGVPTNVSDTMPNNALIVTNMTVQGVSNIGYELRYFAGSKFVNDEAENGVNGWALCGYSFLQSTTPCQFGHFANILSDTTSGPGVLVQQGTNAQAATDIQISNVWIGSSTTYGLLLNGVTYFTGRGIHVDKGDDAVYVTNSNNVTIDADIHDYNHNNNGSYAAVLNNTTNSVLHTITQSNNTVLGYNGITETGSSSGNRIYGGPASCSIGVAFGGGSTGLTYNTRSCEYEIKGMQVSVQFYTSLSAVGSSTGAATLTGLPIQPGPASGFYYGGVSPVMGASGMASLTGPILAEAAPGGTTVNLYAQGASGTSALTNSNFSNTSTLIGQLNYFKQ
jgi:hypothetical protein